MSGFGPLGWPYGGGYTSPTPDTSPVGGLAGSEFDTSRAERMIENLPPYLRDDPTVRSFVFVCARELDRIEAAANALRAGAFPDAADLRTLIIYEALFRISAAGLGLDARHAAVVAHMRKRHVATRYDWQAALTALLGAGWSYVESTPYMILLHTPVELDPARTAAVAAFAREITPAHLDLTITDDFGAFQVGISLIGDDL
jgi:hypothetical protein